MTLGYLISRSPYLIRVFEPLLAGIYAVPIILFLPLFVLFFGLGPGSKIAIGVSTSFFPIVLNTIAGFGYVDRIFITAARSMGASDVQMFRHVLLPAALPVILTGLRIGFTVTLLSVLGSETLASLAGLGHKIVHLGEGDGDGADVRLYRLRRGDRGDAQHRGQRGRAPGGAAAMNGAAQLKRFLLRRPGLVRFAVIAALFAPLGGVGEIVDRSDVPQPAVHGADVAGRVVLDPRHPAGAASHAVGAGRGVRHRGGDRPGGGSRGRAVAASRVAA